MSIGRKNTVYRRDLIRICGTCGKRFSTTAASPWSRRMPQGDKKNAHVYFCSSACKKASYKPVRRIRWWDEREHEEHMGELREQQRQRYWADPEAARANCRYQYRKRKLAEAAG